MHNLTKDSFKHSLFLTKANLIHTIKKWSNSAKFLKNAVDIKNIHNLIQTNNSSNPQNKKRNKDHYSLKKIVKIFPKILSTTNNKWAKHKQFTTNKNQCKEEHQFNCKKIWFQLTWTKEESAFNEKSKEGLLTKLSKWR